MCYDTYNRCLSYQWAGSAAKWENGWLAKWARRLDEAEVPGTWSSKGESKGRDWKFEEARGETFDCEFVELSWLSCYGVTCLFCFWAVYGVTWQVMLGCNMHMNLLVFGQVISGCNKYSVKWPGVLNEYIVLNWSQSKSNNKIEKIGGN